MYTIKELIIYPIKSLAGISVSSSKACEAGFEYDRRWMLLDEENKFLTQRSATQMALFIPAIEDDFISINYKSEKISFGINETSEEDIVTKVWDDVTTTNVVSEHVNNWFSRLLERKVTLVKIKSEFSRKHHNKTKDININVSLADGYPYLLIGEESLRFLNTKLQTTVLMNRFRPNIVVTSNFPHEEDSWKNIKIGNSDFVNLKPCGRCMIINIDQQTTAINDEPLKVLNTYRKLGNNVIFGTNLMCITEGYVNIGDLLTIGL
ncbi:MAG: MOSC domain-containing protein [Saprospiraceae bacterium]|nr:MOSC domain-containing protein [Saprospiraceae bacterium]